MGRQKLNTGKIYEKFVKLCLPIHFDEFVHF